MKTALVMEGGAMRGMFTCGVIDVFMENSAAISNRGRSAGPSAITKNTAGIPVTAVSAPC